MGEELNSERKKIIRLLAWVEDGAGPREWDGVAAEWHQFRITEDGEVVDVSVDLGNTPQDVIDTRRAVRAEVEERIAAILRRAQEIDDDLVDALTRVKVDLPTMPGEIIEQALDALWGGAPAPPPGGSPDALAGWWATLTGSEREWLIAHRPEAIGTMDGLPVAARSEANLGRLPAERARLVGELDAARAERDDVQPWQWRRDRELGGRIEELTGKLDSLDAIDEMMAGPDRSLITLDLDGERARAAIGTGDVDGAENVSVFTPGMNSTVDGNLERYVREMEQVQDEAQRLLEHDGFTANHEAASVVWLDYEPPLTEGLEALEGAQPDRYEEGTQRLEPFLDGLRSQRGGGEHLHRTSVGHSYGSPTAGMAARESVAADALVFHGSPGAGAGSADGSGHLEPDHADAVPTDSHEMGVPTGSMYNLSNEGDWIANTGWHGVNPTLDTHITELSTEDAVAEDGRRLHGTEGHTSYVELRALADDSLSTSEYNTAAVIANKPDRLIEQPQ